jgi:ABC-type glutathione transport system ATPase component
MPDTPPLLVVRHLVKEYTRRRGLFLRASTVRAVDDVSFEVRAGETLGLVGESGSGKTTTARMVLRLIEPTAGEVRFRGEDVLALRGAALRRLRRQMQMVFQDPWSSLNPRMSAGTIVEEPLVIHGVGDRAARRERVDELFRLVGLDPAEASRRPAEFSGGQRQRIGLARALALEPTLLVADEPVSALDVSVQAQVLNLLMDLRERLNLTYLFVAHDLRVVRHLCTHVAVMHRGRIVEAGPADRVFGDPRDEYTRSLLTNLERGASLP